MYMQLVNSKIASNALSLPITLQNAGRMLQLTSQCNVCIAMWGRRFLLWK